MDSFVRHKKREKFHWSNLREDRCPKCSSKLCPVAIGKSMACSDRLCDFVISAERLASLKKSMTAEKQDRKWSEDKNFEALRGM